jgi:hypothetical protein
MTGTTPSKRIELNIRRAVMPQSQLGLILRYLDEGQYDLTYEVSKLLEVRFLPAALQKYEGGVEKAVALACSRVLHGLAVSIEDLAEITSSSQPFQSGQTIVFRPTESLGSEDTKALRVNSSELDSGEDESEKVSEKNVEFSEKIFGLT